MKTLLTCEHGGNQIPSRFASAFVGAGTALKSHRGWDPGALTVAREMGRALKSPLIYAQVSRLLIDLNRTPGNAKLLSEWSAKFSRADLLREFHEPYWARVREALKAANTQLAVHSFTPIYRGYVRATDIGLLFDPKSERERARALRFRLELRVEFPGWKIHLNRPYFGSGDGLCTEMRKEFKRYIGLEIELNQRLLKKNARGIGRKLARAWLNSESL